MKRLPQIIATSQAPSTVRSLAADLEALGVCAGMTLAVHSSLSSIGYVAGGPVAVILALEQVLGRKGTLAMPMHSTDLSDPRIWLDPAVPAAWHEQIRQELPAYRPDLTPTRKMGVIAECFRHQDGTLRSDHPMVSWAARGRHARRITKRHGLPMAQGEASPLRRLYDLDARVLLLGVGYDRNTCFHLAEYRCRFAEQKQMERRVPVAEQGATRWTTYDDIYWYHEDFVELGACLEGQTSAVRRGTIGRADCRLFPLRAAVDFAVDWMNANRTLG